MLNVMISDNLSLWMEWMKMMTVQTPIRTDTGEWE